MIADAELVVSRHLRATPGVTALVTRIGTRTPATTETPWLRITQIADQPRSRPLYFVATVLQVDCYGGGDRAVGQAEASLIARAVRDALDAMPAATHIAAVVTSARSTMRRLPDDTFEPARERFVVEATVCLHPTPPGS